MTRFRSHERTQTRFLWSAECVFPPPQGTVGMRHFETKLQDPRRSRTFVEGGQVLTRCAMDREKERSIFISAALRHIRDAEHLWTPGAHRSVDQAFHLAAFGPECARKAALGVHGFDKAIGHGFDDQNNVALEIAESLQPAAVRYGLLDWNVTYPELSKWKVHTRYWKTGTADLEETKKLIEDARSAVNDIVFALWTDGLLNVEALES